MYRNDTASHLSGLRQANKALQAQGTREDIPTGTTPRKRAWEYDDDWERTQDRDTVLREWRQSQQQHRSKRPRLHSRSASDDESRHDSHFDITRASTPSKLGSEDECNDGADGDKTIRGEPGVSHGDGSGLRLGVPAVAVKPASDVLTGSTSSSSSVSVSASASASATMPGVARSAALPLPSAAVRSSAVGVGKPIRLAKHQYTTRGGSGSSKGVPLADRNLVSRTRKAR